MSVTHHFQLSYSVEPIDQSKGALHAANLVRDELSNVPIEGWTGVEGLPGVITGCLELADGVGPALRQEAQSTLEHALREILRSQGASFDVRVAALVMVDRLGPSMSLQI